MNYLFTAPTIAFTAGDRVDIEQVKDRSYQPYPALSAAGYAEKIQEVLQLYPWEIQLTQLNLLASHDTARLLTIAGGDKETVTLSTLLLLTFPGAPSIYYGDEVGLPGAIDPDSRRGFPVEANWDKELLKTHQELIAIRHAYPCLRTGEYKVLFAEGEVYVFARILDEQELIVGINVSTTDAKVNVDISNLKSQPNKLLYASDKVELKDQDSQISLNIPSRSGCIISEQ